MLDKPIVKLSSEFQETLDHLEGSRKSFFITGRAGTGKSTLLQAFRAATHKKVVVLAPTGVAALNVQGQTLHSFFGFPPRPLQKEEIKPRRYNKLYQELDAIIIDEISMVRADMLDNIDYFLRLNGKDPSKPYGGIQMIFFGDLFQLPPVVSSPEEHILFNTTYDSPYFFSAKVMAQTDFEVIELHTMYRQTDRRFIRLLDEVRSNQMDEETLNALNERFQPDPSEEDEARHFITLSARNATVNELNQRKLNALNAPMVVFSGLINGDFNERLCPAEMQLQLREGAQVMFVRNDNSKKQYVNGTIGQVVALTNDTIKVEINSSEHGGARLVEVEKVKWETLRYALNGKGEIVSEPVGSFTQFPLRLAWAVTIHKAQGKTFDSVMIDLTGGGAFEHGQTYVALSRCRTLGGIQLKSKLRPQDIILDPRVVEYYETRFR